MDLNDPTIKLLREAWNACQRPHEIAYAQRTGSWNGSSRAGKPRRLLIFCQRIESFERAGVRFAAHVLRVETVLTGRRAWRGALRAALVQTAALLLR